MIPIDKLLIVVAMKNRHRLATNVKRGGSDKVTKLGWDNGNDHVVAAGD
ncbi:hypothetical protein [Roseiconus lacunae]|uniref:Uncharacterized protein n=1 Tax=Roseiconus lacunae TaxID=2605694 RepID=A0ABT7PSB7_9BACT|nr:hypothetical protein [Roseiconus lacunae]MDM4019389.1 hypothetical protein [Roseiconus lacunae]